MPIAKLALAATEMNSRHSLLGLSKDGVSVTAFDDMASTRKENGAVDHAATAKKHLQAAGDFFVEAVTPDKALIFGTVAGVAGDKPSVVGGTVGAVAGAVGDLVEAVPAAVVSAAYFITGGYHAARAKLG
jgi:hypothetical protein